MTDESIIGIRRRCWRFDKIFIQPFQTMRCRCRGISNHHLARVTIQPLMCLLLFCISNEIVRFACHCVLSLQRWMSTSNGFAPKNVIISTKLIAKNIKFRRMFPILSSKRLVDLPLERDGDVSALLSAHKRQKLKTLKLIFSSRAARHFHGSTQIGIKQQNTDNWMFLHDINPLANGIYLQAGCILLPNRISVTPLTSLLASFTLRFACR